VKRTRVSKRTKAILALIPILAITGAVVAQSLFATTTNTVNVGTTLTVTNMWISFDTAPTGTNTPCTAAGDTWSCPQSVIPTLEFSGDYITYGMTLNTNRASEPVTSTFTTTPTYAGLTATYENEVCGTTTINTGLPTLTTANPCYNLFIIYTVSTPSGGSFSLTTNING
jgi:hypothetical protein